MKQLIFIFYLNLFNYGSTFNLSPIPNLKFTEPNFKYTINKIRSSLFGYAVNLRKNSVIIGAPRAQSTLESQSNINETGAVYKCNLETKKCEPFIFDSDGNIKNTTVVPSFLSLIKENQWLGATIDGGSADSDYLIACAPNIITDDSPKNYLFHGVCYFTGDTLSSNATNLEILSPLRLRIKQVDGSNNFLWVYGQLGISVHISSDQKKIIIGAPGVYAWKGTVARFNVTKKNNNYTFISEVANPNTWNQKDDSYFGFAITSANFNDDSSKLPETLYVTSAPQGNLQIGEVIIFDFSINKNNPRDRNDKSIQIYRKFYGYQMGEYFGYALMVDDFNGDGLMDLVVAAPFYSKPGDGDKCNGNEEHKKCYDNGKVYIYLNKGHLRFSDPISLMSDYEFNGRFGMSLGKIGDINRDGYKDIAIGAPFEGNGAVYIFLGGLSGLSKRPSQKLSPPLNEHLIIPHYFGYTLSRGVDYDNNGFNDFAISAPNIDTVYVYKSYPVVKIIASITPASPTIDILETKSNITVCLRYESVVKLKFKPEIQIKVILDPILKRAKLESDGSKEYNKTLEITSKDECINSNINLQYVPGDIFKPIVLELHYEVLKKYNDSLTFCIDCVALNPNDLKLVKNKIIFSTGCLKPRCVADLNIHSKISGISIPYVLGTSKSILIEYTIENFEETAYSVELIVKLLSKSSGFNRIPSNCKLEEGILYCNAAQGKPLYKSKPETNYHPSIKFNLSIDTTHLDGAELVINTTATSSSDEKNYINNICIDKIPLAEFCGIEIIGKSSEPEISVEEAGLILQEITHSYQIRNMGPSNFNRMLLTISIPVIFINKTNQNFISLINPTEINVQSFYDNTEIEGNWSANIDNSEIVDHLRTVDVCTSFNEFECNSNMRLGTFKQNKPINISDTRNITNEFDETVLNLPQNRLFYFNCSSDFRKEHFCIHKSFEIRNFLAGDKLVEFKVNFKIDLGLIDKLYTVDRDIFVMFTTANIEHGNDLNRNSLKAIILNPYTIITKYVKESTPIWIIIVSVLGGILVLIGIVYGLRKAGFFRRTKKFELAKLRRQSIIEMEMRYFDLVDFDDHEKIQ